jgi:serine/threonine-protein kinase HipA
VKSKALRVTLPGRDVGALVQDRGGLVVWTPDHAWEAGGQHPRLGVEFLRDPGRLQRAGTGLPGWFENLLPEQDSPLRARLAALHGLRDGQSFQLLGNVGGDLAGAVEITPHGSGGSAVPTHRLDDEANVDLKVQSEERAELTAVVGRLSPLAGMQMKFSMSMIHDRLVLPARGHRGQWIVKFPGEYPDLAEVEDATMTWAREAGFDVPPHLTLAGDHLDGLPAAWTRDVLTVYAIERFDRRADGSRIHQEDLCQALSLFPSNKYGDRPPRVTFNGALRFVTDVCDEANGREMARRMGFAIASGNGDAHLKNWSLLWGEATRPSLAPCYDLVSTISWDNLGWTRPDGPSLALKIGGVTRFAQLGTSALSVCEIRSGQPWVTEEVLAGVQRALEAWPRVRDRTPRRMREALRTHWEQVPLLRDAGSLDVTIR